MNNTDTACQEQLNQLLDIQKPEDWHNDIRSALTRALAMPDTSLSMEERKNQNDRLISLMCSGCKYKQLHT